MSLRMQRLASYVRPGSIVYDLCCDHGLIGLTAWQLGIIKQLIYVDQSFEALAGLKETLQRQGLGQERSIEVHHAEAESIIAPKLAADFIIAGVGIQTMMVIIKQIFSQGLGPHRLILGPQQKSQVLRLFLSHASYRLVAEEVVWEAGRFRELIIIEAAGDPISLYGDHFAQSSNPLELEFAAYLTDYYKTIDLRKSRGRHQKGVDRA